MRNRSQHTSQNFTGTHESIRLIDGVTLGSNPWSIDVVDHESVMSDEPSGGKMATKPVAHMVYDVLSLAVPKDMYDSADSSNLPGPGLLYRDVPWYTEHLDVFRPGINTPVTYISCASVTNNDISDCVFKAYNQFVNGVRALDASTSIAELGETPRLFSIWQRRRGLPTNLTNGFLNYSFGWRPLLQDFLAIQRELKDFPKTVRRRLKKIGRKDVVRHFKFDLSSTVEDVLLEQNYQNAPYEWGKHGLKDITVNKRRIVVVTIRAKVKPKLTGPAQDILNKLGALGLIPSFATIWSVTRLSFVIDWFFNVGGAIENLQGSLTHDVSNVRVCVSDKRTRVIESFCQSTSGPFGHLIGRVKQVAYVRQPSASIYIPSLRYPRRAMNYVLLGLIGLSSTSGGKRILRTLDGFTMPDAFNAKVNRLLRKLAPHNRRLLRDILNT